MNADDVIQLSSSECRTIPENNDLLTAPIGGRGASRLVSVSYSFVDQAFAVGGSFLANVVLARTQTKEEYGMFALAYSIFSFLAAFHSAAILEPCTVYGSGRYRHKFSEYLRLMLRMNLFGVLILASFVLVVCLILECTKSRVLSKSFVALGISLSFLLSGTLLRRIFYLQRQPRLAASASAISLVTIACGLWVSCKVGVLTGFSVFLILAIGWISAAVILREKVSVDDIRGRIQENEVQYWREHWQYSKWAIATAIVFQVTMQGYYWLVAAFVSVREVAGFRAIYLLVAPIDQVFIALTLLLLPALAARHSLKQERNFLSLLALYGLVVLAATVFFAIAVRLIGKLVLHSLYAGKFDDLTSLFYLLALLPLFMGISSALGGGLNAAEQPKLVFYAYGSSGFATLICGIMFVKYYGLRGAIYGMLLSGAALSVALGIAFCAGMNGRRSSLVQA